MRLHLWTFCALALVAMSGCADETSRAATLMKTSYPGVGQTAPIDANSLLAELDALRPAGEVADEGSLVAVHEWLIEQFGEASETETAEYEFSPDELLEIATLAPGLPLSERWSIMRQEMELHHPGKIAHQIHWTFNAAGNVVCQIAMIYASPREYVAFFGTPIGASGFSGRYPKAEVWDVMVQGEMWTSRPGEFEKSTFVPGQYSYLAPDDRWTFRYVDSTWMIDYGRGNILSMFPYGVIRPAFFNTLDYGSALEQFLDYAKLVIQDLFHP